MTPRKWPWDSFPDKTSTWDVCLREYDKLTSRLAAYERVVEAARYYAEYTQADSPLRKALQQLDALEHNRAKSLLGAAISEQLPHPNLLPDNVNFIKRDEP